MKDETAHIESTFSAMAMAEMLQTFARHKALLVGWILTNLTVAILYILMAPAQFSSTAEIILNSSKQLSSAINSTAEYTPPLSLDSSQADSQIQVLKSERLLSAVFTKHNSLTLDQINDQIAESPKNTWLNIMGFRMPAASEERVRRQAFEAFASKVSVRRLGQSYVLQLSFQASDPAISAKITNAIAMQYIKNQIELKSASIQRGTEYLKGRIESIKSQLSAADDGVNNGIIPNFQFPDADAQVISSAVPPLSKTSPKTSVILAISATFGIVSVVAVVIVWNIFNGSITTPAQVERLLRAKLLGTFKTHRKHYVHQAASIDIKKSNQSVMLSNQFQVAEFRSMLIKLRLSSSDPNNFSLGLFSWSKNNETAAFASSIALSCANSEVDVAVINVGSDELKVGNINDERKRERSMSPRSAFDHTSVFSGDGNTRFILKFNIDFDQLDGFLKTCNAAPFDGLHHTCDKRVKVFDLPSFDKQPEIRLFSGVLDHCIIILEEGVTSIEQAEMMIRALHSAGAQNTWVVLSRAT